MHHAIIVVRFVMTQNHLRPHRPCAGRHSFFVFDSEVNVNGRLMDGPSYRCYQILEGFKDLLQCFKKETSKITEMGGFIFKVRMLLYFVFDE